MKLYPQKGLCLHTSIILWHLEVTYSDSAVYGWSKRFINESLFDGTSTFRIVL